MTLTETDAELSNTVSVKNKEIKSKLLYQLFEIEFKIIYISKHTKLLPHKKILIPLLHSVLFQPFKIFRISYIQLNPLNLLLKKLEICV